MKRVFILGAGASRHAGVPVGNEIIRHYIENSTHLGVSTGKDPEMVRNTRKDDLLLNHPTLVRILSFQPCNLFDDERSKPKTLEELINYQWPDLQDVLTFFDMATQREESFLGCREENLMPRQEIIDFISNVIRDSVKNITTDTYLTFAQKLTSEDVVISFNYDALLDNAVDLTHGSLNYPLDISCIDYHPHILEGAHRTLGVPIPILRPLFEKNSPLIIKPHGSFNLMYCPDCYDIFYRPHKLPESEEFHRISNPSECENERCRYSGVSGNLEEYLITLSYYKRFSNPLVVNSWTNVVKALSNCDIVYFLGYSLPDADISSKYFFIRGLKHPEPYAKVVLVNPNADKSGLTKRFKGIFGNVDVVDGDYGKFENFVLSL